ncbi:MAG: hypothetical protein EPN82_12650 [Bacteroidetes bacterium]|nr:MAG: hypothetical protein EPN82_12650 [Bacteroidota bacterium]
MQGFISSLNFSGKILLFIFILLSISNLQSQTKPEIQIITPSDMEAINSANIYFQWIPIKENNIKFKITIARIVDTGMSIKFYPKLEDAPKSFFLKGFKIYSEMIQTNEFKITDIATFLNDKPQKGKKEEGKKIEGVGNIPEASILFYAWQVEEYTDNKFIASSPVNIFLWNNIAPPTEIYIPELLEPEDDAMINPDSVRICWKGGEKGIKYQVNFIYTEKDTNNRSFQPGPFDYITITQEKKTLDSLIYTIDTAETVFFEQLSKNLEENSGNIKTYNDKFSSLKSKLTKRAKSEGITLIETSCEMLDSCESEPVCSKLKTNDYLHRDLFLNRYKCLLDKIQMQNISIQNLILTYSKYQKEWINADNKSTDFGIYNDFVNLINVMCEGKLDEIEKEVLPSAFSIVNCLDKIQKQLSELIKCRDYVKNCVVELKAESNKYKDDLLKQKNGVVQLWNNDSMKIDSDIGLAVWEAIGQLKTKSACCPPNTSEIKLSFPPYEDINSCYRIFILTLNKYLGERLCYLKINVNYDCNTNNVFWTWSAPEKKKFPNCYQLFDNKVAIDTITEDGNGLIKCYPNNENERKKIKSFFDMHPNCSWEIDAFQNDITISASTRREINTKSIFIKDTLNKPKETSNPVKNCNCVMRLLLNRVGVPPLNQKSGVQIGVPAEIAIDGKCKGDCFELEKIIRIINPEMYYGGMKFPVPPVLVYGSVLQYNFPYCGNYTIYGTTICSDSVIGTDKFYAETKCTITNLEQAADNNMSAPDCPSCGCISMYYMHDKVKASIINNFLYLGKPQNLDLFYESHCFSNCSKNKEIEWQIVDPDAKKTIKKGKNHTELKYNFSKKGRYKICIVEQAKCGAETKECSIFLTVDTGQ